jgi:hypothetical protein
MYRIRSIELHPRALVQRVNLRHTLVLAIKIALALLIAGSMVFALAVRIGIAPDFDQYVALDAQHSLLVHNGPIPTCSTIPNPPQHDCFRPGPERRVFSVDYLTPEGVRSLVWFRLPAR